jgi:hypothetical protein
VEFSSRFSFIWLPAEDSSSQEEKGHELEEFFSDDVKEGNLLKIICRFDRKNCHISVLAITWIAWTKYFPKAYSQFVHLYALCILLRILITMPVSVAEDEWSRIFFDTG